MSRYEGDPGYEFWNSPAAARYPSDIDVMGVTWLFSGNEATLNALGGWMDDKHYKPSTGNILDIGAGPSSGFLYGDLTDDRVYAVDYSPMLLAQNPIPDERKVVMDLRSDEFPLGWEGAFSLITSVQMFRYLHPDEQVELAVRLIGLLQPHGRLLIIDTPKIPNRIIAPVMGEVAEFHGDSMEGLFQKMGLQQVQSGSIFFRTNASDRLAEVLEYATGVR